MSLLATVVTLLSLAVGAPAVVLPGAASAALPAGGMAASDLNAMFATYGNAGNHWTGGDSTTSVLLPDGRVVWLFSDTYLGTVNADLTRPQFTPMINNSAVVQDGTALTDTLYGGTAAAPRSLVPPDTGNTFYWVADGTVEGGKLKVFYNRMRRSGTEALDFELAGTALATFDLPSLTLSSVVSLPVGSTVNWGSDVLVDGGYTYIYGEESAPGRMKFAHVARAAAGNLGGAWQFWTGSAWSDDPAASGRLLSGVGTAFGVQKVGSQYVLVTHENNLLFDSQIVAYTATSPTGPFTGQRYLYTAPEVTPGGKTIVYDVRLHPELARSGKLLLSYNVNSLELADQYADVRLYRPRFVEVDWPPAAAPTQPAAPSGLTVSAAKDDTVDLTWTAVSGAAGYRVYQRDVTGGQTQLARGATPVTTASYHGILLVPGHQYEFAVSTIVNNVEGPPSGVVLATPHSSKAAGDAVRFAGNADAVAGVYLVRLRTGAVPVENVEWFGRLLLAQYGGTFRRAFPLTLHGFSATLTEAQAVDLASHPDVVDVEQDMYGDLAAGGGQQTNAPWHLDRIDQRDNVLDQTYHYPGDGSGVTVWVVDSGIRADHSEFGGRVATGYNAIDLSTNTTDNYGHGTAVAGAIGGATSGVAKGVRMVPVKVTDSSRVQTERVVAGVEWVNNHLSGPTIINLSLTDYANYQGATLNWAVGRSLARGITVVTAAGNKGSSACTGEPQSIADVITVGAAAKASAPTAKNTRYPTSNYGSCVDIWAPGQDIVTASKDGGSTSLSETSMAAGLVSGAAAIVLSAHPDYGPAAVQQTLVTDSGSGAVEGVGTSKSGMLYIGQPPWEAPKNLTATPNDNGTIGLKWDPIAEPNVHYVVSQRDVTAGEAEFVAWSTPVFGATQTTSPELQPGHQYDFVVAAANSTGTGPPSNVASATANILGPPKVTGLTATPVGDGSIDLKWNSLGDLVWYWVYQRDVTAGETEFTKLELPITTGTSMNAAYLTHGHEYEFRVSGTNRGGEGPQSDPARATSSYPEPAPPTNLTAENGDGQVILRWTASITANVWYWVYQRDVTAGETDFTKLELPVPGGTTLTAGYLTNGHTYEFKVTSTYFGRDSAASNVVQGKPQVPLPGQVTGLTATPQGDGTITLTWNPPGDNLWYDVYQRDATAGESGFTKLPLPVTVCCTLTAAYLTNNHTYEFKVAATNAAGAGPQSAVASATAHYNPPGAPKNLRGEQAGDATIHLDWDPPSAGSFYYWIYMRDVSNNQSSFTKLAFPTDKTEAELQYLANDHVYEFKVTASNVGGEGPASATVQVTAKGGVPAAPTGLSATAGDGSALLSWTASTTSGVTYNVYQRDATAGQSWQKLALPVTGTAMVANYLTNGHTYQWRVTASNYAGTSGPSNVASAKPMPPLPSAPTGLTAAPGDGQVTLKWNSAGNVYYWIEMRPAGGNWDRLPYPVSTCCSFTVKLLRNGTTYEFRVFSNNLSGDSGPSNVASAKPMPPFPQPPSGLTATAGDAKVALKWTASSTGGVNYYVELRARGGSWQRLPYAVSCCAYTVSLLNNGTIYDFRVRASNLSGVSDPSNTASAKPMPPMPRPPSNLRATRKQTSDDLNDLSWTASPTKGVLYNVYQRTASQNGAWQKLPISIGATSMHPGFLSYGQTYEFKVTAVNLSGESDPTNVAELLAVPTSEDTQCASVASNWVLNNLGNFDAIQRYDVAGSVCGMRSNYSFKVTEFWTSSGLQLQVGIFYFQLIDCSNNFTVVWTDTMEYPNGGPTSGSNINYAGINPSRSYAVRVWGAGSTEFRGLVYTRFSLRPPSGIIPFDVRSGCF